MIRRTVLLLAGLLLSAHAHASTILLEAEQFQELGGWVVDQQFMDEMGSPFVLAHGIGHPVADATTTITVPQTVRYRVPVRTRDWVATWKAPGTPGRFHVVVDGKPLATTFGTIGADWHWQDGGTVTLAAGKHTIALHDLTGFEGRCDAILLTTDASLAPPNSDPQMARWRRELLGQPAEPKDGGTYDLVVVGGGIAGTAATIAAARKGARVALIQDRPVLGGNNSSEVRVWLSGRLSFAPYPRVGDVVRELEQKRRAHYGPSNTADLYEDERKIAVVRAEENASLFLGWRGNAVEMKDGRVAAVIAQNIRTGERLRFVCRWAADCTGHGVLGALAGADFEMSTEEHMGRCNLWNVKDTGEPVSFPRCPWALDLGDKPFPGRGAKEGITRLGGWYWESGFNHDPFLKGEYIRDWNFRAMYGAWDALKNVDKRYPNHKLNWSAYVSGPRESRRLLGDVILSKDDLMTSRAYPDGCVATSWKIDVHVPEKRYDKGFEGDAFISKALFTDYKRPYWIPYRCLYSRNVPNLFMAGRNISVTREALGTVRVMRTTGMMGEIVGMATGICLRHGVDPRAVFALHLAELKEAMTEGIGKAPIVPEAPAMEPPQWIEKVGANIAPQAMVEVSGSRDAGTHQPRLLTDGQANLNDNAGRWLSDEKLPHTVTLTWKKPQAVTALRVISGYRAGGKVSAPINDFSFQAKDTQGAWCAIEGASDKGNAHIDWHVRFPPVTTAAIRLTVTRTQVDISRVWEVEVYGTKQ